MRHKWREWRNTINGKWYKWDRRIIWFCNPTDGNFGNENIKLVLETEDGKWTLYPTTEEKAEGIWNKFKLYCPKLNENYGLCVS